MKKVTILFLSVASILGSCTKSANGPASGNSYSCACQLMYLGKDTTMYFNYNGISSDSAQTLCDARTKWVQSIGGPSAGGCHLN